MSIHDEEEQQAVRKNDDPESSGGKAPNTRSLRRTLVYVLATFFVLVLVIEAIGLVAFAVTAGRMFDYDVVQKAREDVRDERLPSLIDRPDRGPVPHWQVLHPYLGFVLHPSPEEDSSNEYGFIGTLPPFAIGSLERAGQARSEVIVAVFGGSVAQRMAHNAGDVLASELAGSACFEGRDVRVANLALPGVKQPQQLMTLEYFLSIGAAIDVVISLDGFNEVALPIAENLAHEVNPFYPRNWKFHVAGLQDIPTMRRIGVIEFWRETRKGLARGFSTPPLRWSVMANTVWWLVDQAIERHVTMGMLDITLAQAEGSKSVGGYLRRGPSRTYANEVEHYRDLVAVWERSTHLLAQASGAAGIASFHFLQPNQRVPDSKVFTEEERRVALPRRQAYDVPARKGYPELIAAAARMRDAGLPFHDLTMVFADTPEQVYVDGCCHVNPVGSEILARAIADAVKQDFASGRACPGYVPVGAKPQ
ncbi:MAG: hypothetical protein QF570_18390 [Myxococcota bacterium]|jgi:hypothetical protein|nr:hypothetical protein [Myxococcota bacterium]